MELQKNFKQDVRQALDVLRSGGIILYPTDTIWGIGCDATNPLAVEKIYKIKDRSKEKSVLILVGDERDIPGYVREVPDVAYQLIEYTDKPLTIIYDGAKNLAANLIAADGSVGIRVVRHTFCSALLQQFRKPIVSTSANLSGEPSPKTFHEVSEKILTGVDYVVKFDQDKLQEQRASTIIKLGPSGQFKLIRK